MLEKILFVPDTHVPYHDKKAFALLLKVAKSVKFDRVVTLGDFADFFQVSFHEKKLAQRAGFGAEVREVNVCLDQLDKLGIKKKHYVAGNHEYRFDRYLTEKAPELTDLPGLSIPELLRLKARGWTYTPYKHDLRIGKLWVTHDEGTAGPLANIKARSTYEGNVVIGHCHAMSVNYRGNARGEAHVGASFGWLGDRSCVDYMHSVKAKTWQLGFGIGNMTSGGIVHLQAVPIINNSCVVEGKLFK